MAVSSQQIKAAFLRLCVVLWIAHIEPAELEDFAPINLFFDSCIAGHLRRKIVGSLPASDTLQDSTGNSSIDKAETSFDWQEYFSQLQDTTDALPCHIHLPVCLWIMDPHSRAPKKNTSCGNEVLPQDTTHLTQRPCHQRGSPCQDPASNWTTWRSPDDRKETQTSVVWSCLPFIRSGQNHLASTVKGERRQGRQRKRWEDNIREWTGLEFGKSQRAVQNREKWRKLVSKSSVVPQRPSRLRDWWWWWWWWWCQVSYIIKDYAKVLLPFQDIS